MPTNPILNYYIITISNNNHNRILIVSHVTLVCTVLSQASGDLLRNKKKMLYPVYNINWVYYYYYYYYWVIYSTRQGLRFSPPVKLSQVL